MNDMTDKELRELDAWIAEHVMDKCAFEPHHTNNALCSKCCHDCSFDAHRFPSYTTDPADAMEVLKKCIEKSDYCIEMAGDSQDPIWMIAHGGNRRKHGFFEVEAKTLELAICKFAQELFSK